MFQKGLAMLPYGLKKGQKVRLLTKPDGCSSKFYSLTVGNIYELLYYDGSNVVTTIDIAGEDAHYWRGRVEAVSPTTLVPKT